MPTELSLSEIAQRIGGAVSGDGSVRIARIRDLATAGPGDLTFLSNPKYRPLLRETRASAAIVGSDAGEAPCPTVRVDDPYLGLCRALALFHPVVLARPAGVHPSAVVDPGATLGTGVSIGPLCVVEAGAVLEAGVTLRASVFVGEGATIGEGSYLYPGVVLRERVTVGKRVILHAGVVVGGDGYGYARDGRSHRKIPQIGSVRIGDDVEIGAGSTVDRGALGDTVIGRGTKIDNLVMVAHNVVVGEDCLLVAQSGVAGSTRLGDRVTIAAQSGVSGHLSIGEDAMLGAKSAAFSSIPPKEVRSGVPARPHAQNLRVWAAAGQLPKTLERIRAIEDRIDALEAQERAEGEGAEALP